MVHLTHEYMISVDLSVNIDNSVFRYTGVYGPSNQTDKLVFFSQIQRHKPQLDYPWMIREDFNVTLNIQDRTNQDYPQHNMSRFRALIQRLQLTDLRLQGRRYTWSRGIDNPTYARLDRFLVSTAWADFFPSTTQTTITNQASDHCPIICTYQSKFPTTNVFRMENGWLSNPQFQELVKQTWSERGIANTPQKFYEKLVDLRKKIITWKKEYIRQSNSQIDLCTRCLQWLITQSEHRQLNISEKVLLDVIQRRHTELNKQKEEKWYQRAKHKWIKMGDKNTKFFHQVETQRKRSNWIDEIQDQGIHIVDHKHKAKAFHTHFINLVGTEHKPTMDFDYHNLF